MTVCVILFLLIPIWWRKTKFRTKIMRNLKLYFIMIHSFFKNDQRDRPSWVGVVVAITLLQCSLMYCTSVESIYSSREHWAIKKRPALHPWSTSQWNPNKCAVSIKLFALLSSPFFRIVNVCDGDSPKCGHTLDIIRPFLRLFILYNFDRDNIRPWLIPRVIEGPHLVEKNFSLLTQR